MTKSPARCQFFLYPVPPQESQEPAAASEAPVHAGTGQCPGDGLEVESLRAQIEKLKVENSQLVGRNHRLEIELSNLKALQSPNENEIPQQGDEAISDEAQRKRLERICKRKADGTFSGDLTTVFQNPKRCCHSFPMGLLRRVDTMHL